MELIVIRHGQSENNRLFAETGSRVGRTPDPALSEEGELEVAALAAGLADAGITHLYSALTRKSLQTASALAETLGVPVVGRADLGGVGGLYQIHGSTSTRQAFPGLTPEEMREACPGVQLPDTLTDGEPWDGSFERESDAPARAGALIGELQDTHDQDDVVAVVTHPHFGQLLLQTGVGFRGDARAFVLDTASATAVQLGDKPVALYVNRVFSDHQPGL
ncbi:histidine phosphatase family protein [Arsenicicoccus piscis]|uniref:Phosphoglycerate mutase n=1 Tax=Arsenicicoccus piscis TaxID=673954 RepID=A0ABQ6HNY8_9MICO|nr:histidine phosphatase family protein [Arsenicicoccus piscis]MCH8628564.1 histidine phosphatase family protein [Arsenicicoccus piscis]GMA19850.1 phosphoglycerate mutase [Arsenicicoccus piscis]